MALPTLDQPTAYDIAEKSQETIGWLRNNVAVGFTSERGPAWHSANKGDPLDDRSHFDGPVPQWRVLEILGVEFAEANPEIEVFGEKITDMSNKAVAVKLLDGTINILNYPSANWKLHPYIETLNNFIQQITGGAEIGSVGLLQKGGLAFVQAVLPETHEVAGYGYQPYLMGLTSANGNRATTYGTGIKAGVCDNTVDMAVAGFVTSLKRKHTRNSQIKVQQAREGLGIQLAQVADQFENLVTELTGVDVSEKDFDLWLDEIAPVKDEKGEAKTGRSLTQAENKRGKFIDLRRDPKVAPWDGTLFGTLQLNNTFETWASQDKATGGGRFEKNLTAVATGTSARSDRLALDTMRKIQERTLTFA